jgi:hypothetical protein
MSDMVWRLLTCDVRAQVEEAVRFVATLLLVVVG